MNLNNLKNRALQNREVKAEYENLSEEFALIDSLISMRKKSGFTQEDVAQKMGTQKSNISRLEKGTGNPSWKTLRNYAHACGFEIFMKFKEAR